MWNSHRMYIFKLATKRYAGEGLPLLDFMIFFLLHWNGKIHGFVAGFVFERNQLKLPVLSDVDFNMA